MGGGYACLRPWHFGQIGTSSIHQPCPAKDSAVQSEVCSLSGKERSAHDLPVVATRFRRRYSIGKPPPPPPDEKLPPGVLRKLSGTKRVDVELPFGRLPEVTV